MYLDSDFITSQKVVLNIYDAELKSLDVNKVGKDPKTVLQEILQARKMPLPTYTVVNEYGEAHKKTFVVTCQVQGMGKLIEANGKSKRRAEQAAASKILALLEQEA